MNRISFEQIQLMTSSNHPKTLYTSPWQLFLDIVFLIVGCILYAVAINGILIPQNFVTGGITGISLIIHKFIPSVSTGWIYLLLNIPLFALAWMTVGRRFFFYSLLGMLFLTISIFLVDINIELEDRMLSSLLAGLILGTGGGLCLRTPGSMGGNDILSVILMKRFSISIGNTTLSINVLVLLLVSIFYSLEAVLYTLVVLFVSSKVINLVVTGLSKRKAVLIISPHWETISREILKDIRHGVTIIGGRGGFSGREEFILYTVIPFLELGDLKRLINSIDPDAFVVIQDTLEVMNYRIGNQPHWR